MSKAPKPVSVTLKGTVTRTTAELNVPAQGGRGATVRIVDETTLRFVWNGRRRIITDSRTRETETHTE